MPHRDVASANPDRWDTRARTQLAHALRSRVAGDDAAEKAAVIWGAEGERWFTPEDPVWRVHADAAMFPGGIRALLLQSLHPLAMAGVAGHSGFKGDPWGRLQRTSEFLATTTFGTIEHAEQQIARVRSIHERVRGKAADGRPYTASDPHLLRWVHITEVDSFLTAFQRYAAEPLTDAEAALYVEQAAVVRTEGIGPCLPQLIDVGWRNLVERREASAREITVVARPVGTAQEFDGRGRAGDLRYGGRRLTAGSQSERCERA